MFCRIVLVSLKWVRGPWRFIDSIEVILICDEWIRVINSNKAFGTKLKCGAHILERNTSGVWLKRNVINIQNIDWNQAFGPHTCRGTRLKKATLLLKTSFSKCDLRFLLYCSGRSHMTDFSIILAMSGIKTWRTLVANERPCVEVQRYFTSKKKCFP